jgi:hypothetical protein
METISGEILQVSETPTFTLLVIGAAGQVVEHQVEPRYLRDILEGEGLAAAADLEGRQVTLDRATGELFFEELVG